MFLAWVVEAGPFAVGNLVEDRVCSSVSWLWFEEVSGGTEVVLRSVKVSSVTCWDRGEEGGEVDADPWLPCSDGLSTAHSVAEAGAGAARAPDRRDLGGKGLSGVVGINCASGWVLVACSASSCVIQACTGKT